MWRCRADMPVTVALGLEHLVMVEAAGAEGGVASSTDEQAVPEG